ncbi:MAG TPA: helix-turn-helix transcriptional regulator [Polyangiaceae bacterium]|nr:helix-turn-helix transcriptional regulator [Polyangiaceae bacterium]
MKIQSTWTDEATLRELGKRLARYRLARNLTQADLAREAGVSKRTVERVEGGESAQLSSFIRLLRALGLGGGLDTLVPESSPSPLEELELRGKHRKRASHREPRSEPRTPWKWGEET